MRRSRVPSNEPGRFLAAQFSAGCTTNTAGFDFRQAQPSPWSKHDKWVKIESCGCSGTVGPARGFGGAMIHWIESQSTSAIIGIVFCLCYAFAAAVFGFAAAFSRRHLAEQLKTISPVTLTPLAVILGLLIAFLAARVWENVGRANEYIGQEAGALSRVMLLANALPTEVRTEVQTAIMQHVDFVLAQDWPEMASVRANQRTEPVGLTNAMAALFSFTPTQSDQVLAQQRAVAAVEQAFEVRRNRIRLSQVEIAWVQWVVIFILAILILTTTAMIHIGKPAAMATTLFIFSTRVRLLRSSFDGKRSAVRDRRNYSHARGFSRDRRELTDDAVRVTSPDEPGCPRLDRCPLWCALQTQFGHRVRSEKSQRSG